MNDSARSSIAKVTSPPGPCAAALVCSRPSWLPSTGRTSPRSAIASSAARSATAWRSISGLPGRLLGALAEGHLDLLGVPVVEDLERDRVARRLERDQSR